ncbi:hypothetical protein [Bradyrhizobium sp. OK095]|uniref:hypothetical protein n=1 Tax=Bradyrhizobium sp. OK095 TaxID=1882760 RepID=UPI0008D29B89|nr:hypothetical protein [Bradyrhizobium sp. OK095]SEN67251.1 hypothetical protein SAMN05443254_11035 [Bradyrhizobium sp. OK095]
MDWSLIRSMKFHTIAGRVAIAVHFHDERMLSAYVDGCDMAGCVLSIVVRYVRTARA